ncbi:MAG: carbamoyl phosphate synthase large subunit, partial [Paraglaciecola sp.]
GGKALLSVRLNDRNRVIELAQIMIAKGFELEATSGTAKVLNNVDIACSVVNKLSEGRPNIVDAIKNGEYCYIVNTTEGRQAIDDSVYIRKEALLNKVSYTTTMNAAFATVNANEADDKARVTSVQELHKRIH